MISFKFSKIIKRKYYILSSPKFTAITSQKNSYKKYNILDIGCGGNSPLITKIVFPVSRYVGIDRDFNYHNSLDSIKIIDKKIQHDLNHNINLLYEKLKDEKFDIIIFNHTIEHTYKGLEILELVANNLNSNGCIYIEFPSIRSLALPSMRGTSIFVMIKSFKIIFYTRNCKYTFDK